MNPRTPPPPAPDPQRVPVLVTAGPTQEPIDAVRFIGNRSSGRLGAAVARAAARAGHPTTLLLGPVGRRPDLLDEAVDGLLVTHFRTTADLERELALRWPEHGILVMAAAVADYRPRTRSATKLHRTDRGLVLDLEPTPDLLAGLAAVTRPDQVVIGFALEAERDLEIRAREKLERKHLDAIVANPLATMDATRITARVFLRDGRMLEPPADLDKVEFAAWLVDRFAELGREAARPHASNADGQ